MSPPRVLYCHCAYAQVVPADVKSRVLDGLASTGRPFDAVPDLCEMAARRDPALAELSAAGGTIVACYPRAVRWLFSAGGAPLPEHNVTILNMREQTAEAVLDALAPAPHSAGAEPASPKPQAEAGV